MTLLAVFMSVGTWAQSVTPNPGDTWDDATKTLTVNSNPGDNDYCMAPIEHLIISDGVTSIGGGAFSVCSDLVSVTIGKDLVSIGDYAFMQSGPTSIVFPDNVKTIGARAFEGGQLTSVTIGKGMTSIGHNAFFGCQVENYVVDNANENYKSVDGVLFTIDGKTLMCYPAAHARNKYAIPYGVTTIEESAFMNCDNLISVIIPNSVTSIEKESFYYCI